MQAPSPALLRTLRRLAHPNQFSAAPRPSSQCIRRHHHTLSPASTLSTPSSISRSNPTSPSTLRTLTTTSHLHDPSSSSSPNRNSSPGQQQRNPYAPRHRDRGPASTESTQTDFGKMDIFATANVNAPATSIDACVSDGFHLNNGVKTSSGKGMLLLGGEGWEWAPWDATEGEAEGKGGGKELLDAKKGVLNLSNECWGVLAMMYPRPDLLILGTGGKLWMLSKASREYLTAELGVRVDVMDTANAAAAFNLLSTERGLEGGGAVGAALLPIGWKGR